MFSVNNFYDILASYYSFPKTKNTIVCFNPHGSKDWYDAEYKTNSNYNTLAQGTIICHDQEPCFVNMLTTYRDSRVQEKKLHRSHTRGYSTSDLTDQELYEYTQGMYLVEKANLDGFELLHLSFKHFCKPILCHSELNSNDINEFKQNGFIPCYYWWHGMVARDWLRHWERHADLAVQNKADAKFRFLFYCRDTSGSRKYREKVYSLLPEQSVLHSDPDASSSLSATIDVAHANKSAIHIVAETLFHTDKIYLTEKVFKPMVMSQPFILFAPPGSLQYLQDYGFKTFSEFWNEDYDLIRNADDRLEKIIELINNLNKLSDSEFAQLYAKLLPIIEHNRTWFYSSDFQDLLVKELHLNFATALSEQLKHSQESPGEPFLQILDKISIHGNLPKPWIEILTNAACSDQLINTSVQNYPRLNKLLKQN